MQLVREGALPVPHFSETLDPVPLDPFRDGKNPDLARLFATMVQRGTILDATVWTYSDPSLSGSAGSPPRCNETIGAAITAQAYHAGVAISAGTDNLAPESDPWPDLFHEIDDLVTRAGMPIPAVLHSATLVSARAAGQEREMGSLEPGKLANMVVLARDPLAGIRNLRSVVMTVKRGHVFPRSGFKPLRKGDITDY